MDLIKVGMAILIASSLGLMISAASAQTVEIDDVSMDAGATTTLTIMADDVTDLANFDITVTYDPAVVNVIAADNDAAFGVAVNNLEKAATGSVRLASLNFGSGQTGRMLLSTLTLEAVCTAGKTALTLTINELKNSTEGAITVTLISGSVTVAGEIVETPTAEPTGTISVSSLSSEVTVHIDDAYKGTAPVTVSGVKVGSHTIKLEKSGYETITRTVTVRAYETATVSETLTELAQKTGSISISSSPAGADIYLDAIREGTTPKTISGVTVGSHTIKLGKSGYVDITRTVAVGAGETATISETLTELAQEPGFISISSSPAGADIYLDGIREGTTPKTISGVTVGSHTIRLEKSGHTAAVRNVTLRAGETSNVYEALTELAQKTCSISVSSSPSGADIYLDGAYKGTTPAKVSDVSPGAHTLKLEKYGYVEWLTSAHTTSGVTESITAHLAPADVSPPAIRIDKPTTIDQNGNGLLEEGEKVAITYGANDPSGVVSIKILLDSAMLESQNQAGTYTVTTSSLPVGGHTIRVEATDSRSNSGFEEIHITVERTGPSVYFGTTRTAITKGEDAVFTLSAVNPIGNPPMTVQLILKPPSGVSVTSSSFAKSGSGIYTCTQTIEPGDNVRSIEVRLVGGQVGTHEITSEVYYQFDGNSKSPIRYETLTLVVDEPDSPITPFKSGSAAAGAELPGFAAVVAVAGLLLVVLLIGRRKVD
ncbi:MAG: PEGA domain-containing protein [Euryarchaeota archaeon]|nr:PEGA domain-containing protein [Euryarchaeota archaeon]